MANEEYSKSKTILEAVRNIFVGDNANTGNDVREIEYYCADRVYRGNLNVGHDFPQITISVDEGINGLNLPSGEYFLEVNSHNKFSSSNAQDVVDNMSSRVEFLLSNKPNQLNLAVTSKNLRCRIVRKLSALLTGDRDRKSVV